MLLRVHNNTCDEICFRLLKEADGFHLYVFKADSERIIYLGDTCHLPGYLVATIEDRPIENSPNR